jgi:hypothetical protein
MREHGMAVKRNPDRMPIDELIDFLVKREVMRHEQGMDKKHVRDKTGTVDLPAIDRPEFDNAIRITQGKR